MVSDMFYLGAGLLHLGLDSINTFRRRPARDDHWRPLHSDAAVGVAENEYMSQEVLVIPRREVGALVCAAGFSALQCRIHDGEAHVEHAREFKCGHQFSIEGASVVVETDVTKLFSKLAQLVSRRLQRSLIAVDPRAVFHRRVHLRPDGGNALAASALAQKLFFKATPFIPGLRAQRWTGPPPFPGCTSRGHSGAGAKDEEFGKRVGAKPIGTVDAHTRNFACRV